MHVDWNKTVSSPVYFREVAVKDGGGGGGGLGGGGG